MVHDLVRSLAISVVLVAASVYTVVEALRPA